MEEGADKQRVTHGNFKGDGNIIYGTIVVYPWLHVFIKTHKSILHKEYILLYVSLKQQPGWESKDEIQIVTDKTNYTTNEYREFR